MSLYEYEYEYEYEYRRILQYTSTSLLLISSTRVVYHGSKGTLIL